MGRSNFIFEYSTRGYKIRSKTMGVLRRRLSDGRATEITVYELTPIFQGKSIQEVDQFLIDRKNPKAAAKRNNPDSVIPGII